jgi:hypothetical protein
MTVYVVHSTFYTDHYIERVFDSIDKANKFLDSRGKFKHHFHIEPMEIE